MNIVVKTNSSVVPNADGLVVKTEHGVAATQAIRVSAPADIGTVAVGMGAGARGMPALGTGSLARRTSGRERKERRFMGEESEEDGGGGEGEGEVGAGVGVGVGMGALTPHLQGREQHKGHAHKRQKQAAQAATTASGSSFSLHPDWEREREGAGGGKSRRSPLTSTQGFATRVTAQGGQQGRLSMQSVPGSGGGGVYLPFAPGMGMGGSPYTYAHTHSYTQAQAQAQGMYPSPLLGPTAYLPSAHGAAAGFSTAGPATTDPHRVHWPSFSSHTHQHAPRASFAHAQAQAGTAPMHMAGGHALNGIAAMAAIMHSRQQQAQAQAQGVRGIPAGGTGGVTGGADMEEDGLPPLSVLEAARDAELVSTMEQGGGGGVGGGERVGVEATRDTGGGSRASTTTSKLLQALLQAYSPARHVSPSVPDSEIADVLLSSLTGAGETSLGGPAVQPACASLLREFMRGGGNTWVGITPILNMRLFTAVWLGYRHGQLSLAHGSGAAEPGHSSEAVQAVLASLAAVVCQAEEAVVRCMGMGAGIAGGAASSVGHGSRSSGSASMAAAAVQASLLVLYVAMLSRGAAALGWGVVSREDEGQGVHSTGQQLYTHACRALQLVRDHPQLHVPALLHPALLVLSACARMYATSFVQAEQTLALLRLLAQGPAMAGEEDREAGPGAVPEEVRLILSMPVSLGLLPHSLTNLPTQPQARAQALAQALFTMLPAAQAVPPVGHATGPSERLAVLVDAFLSLFIYWEGSEEEWSSFLPPDTHAVVQIRVQGLLEEVLAYSASALPPLPSSRVPALLVMGIESCLHWQAGRLHSGLSSTHAYLRACSAHPATVYPPALALLAHKLCLRVCKAFHLPAPGLEGGHSMGMGLGVGVGQREEESFASTLSTARECVAWCAAYLAAADRVHGVALSSLLQGLHRLRLAQAAGVRLGQAHAVPAAMAMDSLPWGAPFLPGSSGAVAGSRIGVGQGAGAARPDLALSLSPPFHAQPPPPPPSDPPTGDATLPLPPPAVPQSVPYARKGQEGGGVQEEEGDEEEDETLSFSPYGLRAGGVGGGVGSITFGMGSASLGPHAQGHRGMGAPPGAGTGTSLAMDVEEGGGRHRGSSATSAGLGMPSLPPLAPLGIPLSTGPAGGLGVGAYARQGMVRLRVVGGEEGGGGSFDWDD